MIGMIRRSLMTGYDDDQCKLEKKVQAHFGMYVLLDG